MFPVLYFIQHFRESRFGLESLLNTFHIVSIHGFTGIHNVIQFFLAIIVIPGYTEYILV